MQGTIIMAKKDKVAVKESMWISPWSIKQKADCKIKSW